MTDQINDGGPAFPLSKDMALYPVTDMGGNDVSSGMSLRDWFAAHASEEDIELHRKFTAGKELFSEHYTYTREQARYFFADAMIVARGGR